MSISNIQKEKFLDTLYKSLYAAGNKPKESEILDFFSKYFSTYEPGQPLPINSQIFRQLSFGNVDIFNQKMLYTIFNIETLYDSIFENSEELLTTTTSLNKRLQSLKNKRIALEAKIDDLIFSNQNSEGFYSAYTDTFSSIEGTDLKHTTGFVDVVNGKFGLPTLNSSVFDLISTNSIIAGSPTYSLSFDKKQIENSKSFNDDSFFQSVFDGLDNTEWQKIFYFNSIGVCSFSVTLPIVANVSLSKIEGRLNTISPTDIYIKVNYVDPTKPPEILSKKSTKDYDRFSFSFTSGNVGSIELYLVKVEADFIEPSRADKYAYRFGIRDIAISGQYYDKHASFVSSPLSLNTTDNSTLAIDAVSIQVEESNLLSGSINYFVAEDNESADNISDFSWIPISKNGDTISSYGDTVNFSGSTLKSIKVLDKPMSSTNEITKIALSSKPVSKNLNEQNPIVDLYPNQSIYRIAKLDKLDKPLSSYMLEGINIISGYYMNYAGSIYSEKDTLSTWSQAIAGNAVNRQVFKIPSYELKNNSLFFTGPNLSNISILLDVKIFCPNDIVIKHKFVKNDLSSKDWAVGIYVNDLSYTVPAGVASQMIEWNFKAGINTIKLAIDITGSSNGSISLMEGRSLLDYGLVYRQYYSYVDPLEFKNNKSIYDNVFTIENFFGNKEIFSRQNIASNSRIFYYTNNPDAVKKIRFRADISRGKNPLAAPSLDSFKVKFKNSQSFADLTNELSDNNTSTSSL
jgi:hypothetical protein